MTKPERRMVASISHSSFVIRKSPPPDCGLPPFWRTFPRVIIYFVETEHEERQYYGEQFPGDELHFVAKGDEVVTIESVKAASDILAPLDGVITEVNAAIVENPGKVNDDPMEGGWFFKMTLADPSEFDALMDEAEYRESIA